MLLNLAKAFLIFEIFFHRACGLKVVKTEKLSLGVDPFAKYAQYASMDPSKIPDDVKAEMEAMAQREVGSGPSRSPDELLDEEISMMKTAKARIRAIIQGMGDEKDSVLGLMGEMSKLNLISDLQTKAIAAKALRVHILGADSKFVEVAGQFDLLLRQVATAMENLPSMVEHKVVDEKDETMLKEREKKVEFAEHRHQITSMTRRNSERGKIEAKFDEFVSIETGVNSVIGDLITVMEKTSLERKEIIEVQEKWESTLGEADPKINALKSSLKALFKNYNLRTALLTPNKQTAAPEEEDDTTTPEEEDDTTPEEEDDTTAPEEENIAAAIVPKNLKDDPTTPVPFDTLPSKSVVENMTGPEKVALKERLKLSPADEEKLETWMSGEGAPLNVPDTFADYDKLTQEQEMKIFSNPKLTTEQLQKMEAFSKQKHGQRGAATTAAR